MTARSPLGFKCSTCVPGRPCAACRDAMRWQAERRQEGARQASPVVQPDPDPEPVEPEPEDLSGRDVGYSYELGRWVVPRRVIR